MSPHSKELERIQETLSALLATNARLAIDLENAILNLSRVLESSASLQKIGLSRSSASRCPKVDHRTKELIWKGRSCFLSNSVLLRLAERLVQTPNILISHTVLLEDVWGSVRSESTIRGAAKRLRDQLAEAGMKDLAEAIDGSVHGHYRLNLVQ